MPVKDYDEEVVTHTQSFLRLMSQKNICGLVLLVPKDTFKPLAASNTATGIDDKIEALEIWLEFLRQVKDGGEAKEVSSLTVQ